MTALVIAETVVLLLLGLLVAGLLRSHADILRALHELRSGSTGGSAPGSVSDLDFPGVRPGVAPPRASALQGASTTGFDVAGVTPLGEAAVVAVTAVQGGTLIAFLTSGCSTCASFWRDFARAERLGLPAGVRLVIITKDGSDESPSAVAELAPDSVTTVMSSRAWLDYEVPVSPYFILVDGPTGKVLGEGAATRWRQVRDLMQQALDDQQYDVAASVADGAGGSSGGLDGAGREARADRELMAAGIFPGDPSLSPAPDDIPEAP